MKKFFLFSAILVVIGFLMKKFCECEEDGV